MRPHLSAVVLILICTCAESARSAGLTEVASDTSALPSWTSPLTSRPVGDYRTGRAKARPDLGFASISATTTTNPVARRITQAALLLLTATGTMTTSTGRDTTADIGKQLLGSNNDPFANAIQGGMK